ncbi:MAG TPA: hypothetical protein VGP73_17940, partial [Thermoanaerobaculia bacterium]
MNIPAIVWSGVFGALAGACTVLFTTWLNNRQQNRRQMQQLAHDIEQRRTDREMSLRREVYLEAAETIGKMQEFIANYAQSDDVGSSEIIALNGSIAALNKVHVIGAKSTIEAFNCAQRTFWSCRSRLS